MLQNVKLGDGRWRECKLWRSARSIRLVEDINNKEKSMNIYIHTSAAKS